jgi:hypothetical protein
MGVTCSTHENTSNKNIFACNVEDVVGDLKVCNIIDMDVSNREWPCGLCNVEFAEDRTQRQTALKR